MAWRQYMLINANHSTIEKKAQKVEDYVDYANKQIGFYHKTVNYKGKLKVTPPKIYQFLEEEDEFQPKTIKDRSTVLPKTNPEEVLNKPLLILFPEDLNNSLFCP